MLFLFVEPLDEVEVIAYFRILYHLLNYKFQTIWNIFYYPYSSKISLPPIPDLNQKQTNKRNVHSFNPSIL